MGDPLYRRSPVSISALLPNSSELSPVCPDLPLGSLLVLSLSCPHGGGDLVRAAHIVRTQPWCPLVIRCADQLLREELSHFLPIPASVFFAGREDGHDAWRAGISARPDGGQAARQAYLSLRLRSELVELIRVALQDFTEGSSIRRRLRRARFPAPHVWHDLRAMCECLAFGMASGRPQSEVAAAFGVSVTTLSRRCHRLFRTTWPELSALGNWEAVMECGLRHLGVMDTSPAAVRAR